LVGVLVVATALVGLFVHPAVAVAPLAFLVFTLWFFRDPERTSPDDADVLVSPADGRVLASGPDRVSVFMNLFSVHVCRTPMSGTVASVRHTNGRFLSAYREEAAEANERAAIQVVDGERTVEFTLIAGLVARRIVCRVSPGQKIETGERIGLIQFGSRVDVALPKTALRTVERGQRVVAGETVIARFRPADAR